MTHALPTAQRSMPWSRSCSPSWAWPSIPSPVPPPLHQLPGLFGFWWCFGVGVPFGHQEPPIDGGICHAYFGFWFMFMFSGFYFAISHGSCLVMWFPYPHGILPSVCVMFWFVVLFMCLVLIGYCPVMWFSVLFAHWLVYVMWPLLFSIYSPHVAIRCVRLHAAPRRSAAAWQKQCILVRTFVRLWSALQPPYDHMCHQSTARAKRDQPLRSGAADAQNRLLELWWRHTLFSLVRFCYDKHEVCCVFIRTIKFQ